MPKARARPVITPNRPPARTDQWPADVLQVITAQRQGLDVLMAANRLALHSIQVFVRKQMDLFDDSTERSIEIMKSLAALRAAGDGNDEMTPALNELLDHVVTYRDLVRSSSRSCLDTLSEQTSRSLADLHHALGEAFDRAAPPRPPVNAPRSPRRNRRPSAETPPRPGTGAAAERRED